MPRTIKFERFRLVNKLLTHVELKNDIVQCLQLKSGSYAQYLDDTDPLNMLRNEFCVPEKSEIDVRTGESPNALSPIQTRMTDMNKASDESVIYLAGSAIGLQPRSTVVQTSVFLNQWANVGY